VEWEMLFDLAGQESEKALLGQCSIGARSDTEHWYYLAKLYLKTGCSKLVYFPSPESDWEEKANRKSLEIMLDRQRKILSRFFKENLQVLNELSETLIERERLESADLKPFLNKVVQTPGMPTVAKEYSPHI
jgi:ATP-dependent Zn protease